MGKVSQVSSKYIIHAKIEIEGIVDRPDVIGAIFGQTEGLLGAELELRELQRSGRIGRIEVNVDTKSGKTTGDIVIPSSLDKAETSIVGASLEIIQRIGPCNAKIRITNIEDVRISKRNFVVGRAKELLKNLMDNVMPDSQELADEVAYSVRVMEITEYGKDRLPAGPNVEESDEVLVVEGRADVLNLLKHGIKNAIAMNGTSVPQTIIDLSKKKIITAFVDGDRGGALNIKELTTVADIDHVTRAPDGKEVEELTKKEIHMALRAKVSPEQVKADVEKLPPKSSNKNQKYQQRPQKHQQQRNQHRHPPKQRYDKPVQKKVAINDEEKKKFKEMLENLIGTRGAHILDKKLNILGKVPMTELEPTLKSLNTEVHAIVFDGDIESNVVKAAEKRNVAFLVGMDSKVKPETTKVNLVTVNDL